MSEKQAAEFNILTLPKFADSEQSRKARLIFRILWGLIIILTLIEAIYSIILPDHIYRWITTLLVFDTVMLILLFLNNKGYVRLAAYLLIIFCMGVLFQNAWSSGGIQSAAVRIFPLAIIATGLVIGWKEGIIMGVLVSLGCLGLIILKNAQLLPPSKVNFNSWGLWVNLCLSISLIGLFQYLSVAGLDKALKESRKEIALRIKAEEELKKSEAFRIRVFESSTIPIVIMRASDYAFIDCNPAAVKTYRHSSKQVTIGMRPSDVSAKEQYDGTSSDIKFNYYCGKALLDGSIVFEWRHQRPDGEIWDAEVHLMSFDSGQEKLLQFTLLDITKRKKAEADLENYKNHLEVLVKERTEELATTNEEYKTVNEELYSQKEELQNTIEALNTAQQQLIHSEKMASLGILSAGVAHEINNPLNFISGGILGIQDYFDRHLKDHLPKVGKFIDAISVGIEKVSVIVSSLGQYSRQDQSKEEVCDIHQIIDNCLVMLNNRFKYKVEINKHYTDKVFQLKGNNGELHQAILNILVNAEQSIDIQGTIDITSEATPNELTLTISDSGCGIDKQHLNHIFDPFFTTKPPGKGTGLGLSITYKIIDEHQGSIKYESQPGKGTKVIIRFPVNYDF